MDWSLSRSDLRRDLSDSTNVTGTRVNTTGREVVVVLLVATLVDRLVVVVAAVVVLTTALNLTGEDVDTLGGLDVDGDLVGVGVVKNTSDPDPEFCSPLTMMLLNFVWNLLPTLLMLLSLLRFRPKLVALSPAPNLVKLNETVFPGILGIMLFGSVRSIICLCPSSGCPKLLSLKPETGEKSPLSVCICNCSNVGCSCSLNLI